MRQILKQARIKAGMKQKETAIAIGVSERYYQHIENGTREGKGRIWDALEALFQTSQRQLRENDTKSNSNTEKEAVEACKTPAVAAAELSEVPSSVMVRAAEDLEDGKADTEEGRKVLELIQVLCEAALG
jgi:transcriptional regulator with XRE-family HTH domain